MDHQGLTSLTEDEAKVFHDNLGLAGRFTSAHWRNYPPLNRDEVYAAALIGLYRACQVHDPRKGALSTVAWTYMRGYSEVDRRFTRGGRTGRLRYIGDHVYGIKARTGENIDPTLEAKKMEVLSALSELPQKKQDIVLMSLAGKSQPDVAAKHGCTKQYVSLVLREFYQKFALGATRLPVVYNTLRSASKKHEHTVNSHQPCGLSHELRDDAEPKGDQSTPSTACAGP